MALFKPYNGPEELLNKIGHHSGYVYFSTDKNHMFIDTEVDGKEVRLELNAYAAEVLSDGDVEIDVNNVITKVENGTNLLQTSGNALTGNGVVILSNGVPQVGTLGLGNGGTGATAAEGARTNLDVYSKTEVDTKVKEVASVGYTIELTAAGWTKDGDWYTQSKTIEGLTCGLDGSVPPTCTYTSNLDEYSKIDHAEADVTNHTVTFYTEEQPESSISLILIDK